MNKFGTLDAVSIAVSAEDKLSLIHNKNFQNNERKVNNSFSQYQVLESIRLSMKKGHSYINKPSIILVMHLIDIQRVILRYITVTYRDNNQVIWNKKKCPVCMNFNCMPFSSAFEAVLQDSNRAVFCVKFESGQSSESGNRSLCL